MSKMKFIKKSWLSYGNKIKNHQGLSQILQYNTTFKFKNATETKSMYYILTRQLEILLKLTDKLMPFDTISQTFLDLF